MKKMLAIAVLMLVLATGCAQTFDREGSIDDLVEEGLSRPQATCVIDGTVREFGEDKLMSDDEPTAEEETALFAIMGECILAE